MSSCPQLESAPQMLSTSVVSHCRRGRRVFVVNEPVTRRRCRSLPTSTYCKPTKLCCLSAAGAIGEPSTSTSMRSQFRAGLARCVAAVPPAVLEAHVLGNEPAPVLVPADPSAILSDGDAGGKAAGGTGCAENGAACAVNRGSMDGAGGSGGSGAGDGSRMEGGHDGGGAEADGGGSWKQHELAFQDYRLVTPKVTALATLLLRYKVRDVQLVQCARSSNCLKTRHCRMVTPNVTAWQRRCCGTRSNSEISLY